MRTFSDDYAPLVSTTQKASDGHFSAVLPVRVRVTAVDASAGRSDAEEVIRWRLKPPPKEFTRLVAPPASLLTEFCRLRQPDVSAQRIADFANSWGPLGPRVAHRYFPESRPSVTRGLEHVGLWRSVAEATRAIAILAVALRRGEKGDADAWATIFASSRTAAPKWADLSVRARRQVLTELLEDWLDLGGVGVIADVDDVDPRVAVVGLGPLGGAVALLALGIGSRAGLGICSHPDCREPFIPRQRADPLKASFCSDHHRTGPTLLHKHRTRGLPKRLRNPDYERTGPTLLSK